MANRTALYDTHIALGAKVIDFGGWDMPVDYPTHIIQEHNATRTRAGLFDTGHMGELLVEGENALESLQAMVTRDLAGMEDGQGRYTLLTTGEGTVIDDLIIFKQADKKYYIVTNAGTREGDAAHIRSHLMKGVTLTDLLPETHKLDLQGPKTWEILEKLCKTPLRKLKRFRMINAEVAGIPSIVSRSGYTGETCGVELFFPKADAAKMWNSIMDAGKPLGLLPCGLGARDTLRLECCLPLYGHELSLQITPLEAGLDWAVSLEKKFIGAVALRRQKENGVPRALVALKLGRQPARADTPVFSGDKNVGIVTSGTFGPSVGYAIALALVETAASTVGTNLELEVRGNRLPAVVVEKPFYKSPKS